jgi:hypothetical protein
VLALGDLCYWHIDSYVPLIYVMAANISMAHYVLCADDIEQLEGRNWLETAIYMKCREVTSRHRNKNETERGERQC